MKAALITVFIISFVLFVNAQSTTTKKVTRQPQAAGPAFIKIEDINGESPDTLPPAPKGSFFIGAGPLVSQFSNTNLIERYKVSSRTGFVVNAGYAFAFRKSRLLISASYSEGGVVVASGDINGDGTEEKDNVKLVYITMPVQYQHFLDKKNIFYLGAGGYAALLVPAIQKVRGYNDGFGKQDAGFIASAGVRVGSHIMVQANYQYGLMDIDLSPSNRARNGFAFVMISYSYGPIITIKPKGAQQNGRHIKQAQLKIRKQGGNE
jgi:Outer membrane protein beta-barrel domain